MSSDFIKLNNYNTLDNFYVNSTVNIKIVAFQLNAPLFDLCTPIYSVTMLMK